MSELKIVKTISDPAEIDQILNACRSWRKTAKEAAAGLSRDVVPAAAERRRSRSKNDLYQPT